MDAFARHPVEVRGVETGGAHATEMVGPVLVGSDEENVGTHVGWGDLRTVHCAGPSPDE